MTDTKETVTVKMTLPAPPDGWEYTGEYREPLEGESYRGLVGGGAAISDGTIGGERLIIRKKKWYPKEGSTVWILTNKADKAGLVETPVAFERGRALYRRMYDRGCMYRNCEAAQAALKRIELVLLDAADELNNRKD